MSVILLHAIYHCLLLLCRSHSQSVPAAVVPVDSSAARMPFPAATILWAISLSSFFCSALRKGYAWVMLTGKETRRERDRPTLTYFLTAEDCAVLQNQTTGWQHCILHIYKGNDKRDFSFLSLKTVAKLKLSLSLKDTY